MPAPVASGWSGRRVGLAPTGNAPPCHGARGNQTFFHPFLEQGGVHRPVVDPRHRKPSKAQTGNEGDRLVMAVRDGGPQSPSAPAASMPSSEIGGSAGLVDEDEFRGIKIELGGEPVPALHQNVRAPLLLGVRGLFLKRDAMAVEEAPEHGNREALAAILDQALLDLEQREIRRAADQAEQIVALRLDTAGPAIAP